LLVTKTQVGRHVRHYTSRVSAGSFDRRTFMRVASLAAIGVATGCSNAKEGGAGPSRSPTPTGSASSPAAPAAALAWKPLSVRGPQPRSSHTFTANDDGSIVFLFGGRTKARVFDDAWAYERSTNLWQPLPRGPLARFGHSAAFVDGHLVIFGGRNGKMFFNDAWAFDAVRGKWIKLSPGRSPAPRFGASGATIANSFAISHGFSDSRSFDDTWALARRWVNVTPPKGSSRPSRRWLHRAVYLSDLRRMILYGGQTDGRSFLGDTWSYDATTKRWTEIKGAGPGPRNQYAAVGSARTMVIVGGFGRAGPLNDVWSFDGRSWTKRRTTGTAPRRRGAMEGAIVSGPNMLVFGGSTGTGDLGDLWELSLPA
jgi:Galactose oxidase, central domain